MKLARTDSFPPGRRPGGLARTIAAYDATAAQYARRFENVELTGDLDRFAAAALTGAPVLDAGCGHGRDCRLLAQRGIEGVGLDLSSSMLEAARQMSGAPLVRGDVRSLPYRSASLGGVWCCAVLLHLDPEDFRAALEEFHRVLLAGAPLFVSVRHGVGEEVRADSAGEGRWFKLYSDVIVQALVEDAGFVVHSCDVAPGVSHGDWVNVHAARASRSR